MFKLQEVTYHTTLSHRYLPNGYYLNMGRLLEPSPANIRAWDGVGQTDPEGTVMGQRGTEVPARSSAA